MIIHYYHYFLAKEEIPISQPLKPTIQPDQKVINSSKDAYKVIIFDKNINFIITAYRHSYYYIMNTRS